MPTDVAARDDVPFGAIRPVAGTAAATGFQHDRHEYVLHGHLSIKRRHRQSILAPRARRGYPGGVCLVIQNGQK